MEYSERKNKNKDAYACFIPETKTITIGVSAHAIESYSILALTGLLQHEMIEGDTMFMGVEECSEYWANQAKIDDCVIKIFRCADPIIALRTEKIDFEANAFGLDKIMKTLNKYLSEANPVIRAAMEEHINRFRK